MKGVFHSQSRAKIQKDRPTHYTKFIGLNVHKNSIAVAIADSRRSEVRFYGNIPNTLDGHEKLAKHISHLRHFSMKTRRIFASSTESVG